MIRTIMNTVLSMQEPFLSLYDRAIRHQTTLLDAHLRYGTAQDDG
jgi:hypothetical protein